MMMIDQQLARLQAHHRNIQRYRNLLQTSLTELEREFVEKRLTVSCCRFDGRLVKLIPPCARTQPG